MKKLLVGLAIIGLTSCASTSGSGAKCCCNKSIKECKMCSSDKGPCKDGACAVKRKEAKKS